MGPLNYDQRVGIRRKTLTCLWECINIGATENSVDIDDVITEMCRTISRFLSDWEKWDHQTRASRSGSLLPIDVRTGGGRRE